MVLTIAVATMIAVAIVVFATQYHAYRKNQARLGKLCPRKETAKGSLEAPQAS